MVDVSDACAEHQASIEAEVVTGGTPDGVRDGLSKVRAVVERWGASADAAGTVELVLAEVMNNIVEHAYRDRPDGQIRVSLVHSPNVLSVHVMDHGAGMVGDRLPRTDLPDVEVDLTDLPEGGFGWAMIRELTSGLTYLRRGGCNHLHFRIPLIQR